MYYTIFHRPSSRNKVIKRPALFFRIWWCISYDHPWTINREPGELFCFWWTFLFCVYDLYQKQKLWQHAVAEPIRARVIFSIANIIVVDNYSVHLKRWKLRKQTPGNPSTRICFLVCFKSQAAKRYWQRNSNFDHLFKGRKGGTTIVQPWLTRLYRPSLARWLSVNKNRDEIVDFIHDTESPSLRWIIVLV
jgi:hypothetical protein